MAERDSTKTPVAAEALIAAARAPLALHRIPRGRPAQSSGSARAVRPGPEPSGRRAACPARPTAPVRSQRPLAPACRSGSSRGRWAAVQPREAPSRSTRRGAPGLSRERLAGRGAATPASGGTGAPVAHALREGGGTVGSLSAMT